MLMIEMNRVRLLNGLERGRGKYVLYWVQGCVRLSHNDGLAFAAQEADRLKLPLVVYFGISDEYPEASYRHYHVLLEGVLELYEELRARGIRMVIAGISPEKGAVALGRDAACIITEKAYVRHERQWRTFVASHTEVPFYEVESNLLVPVEIASQKEEYSAYTLRRKIEPMISYYAGDGAQTQMEYRGPLYADDLSLEDIREERAELVLAHTAVDRSVDRVPAVTGGYTRAKEQLRDFIENRLDGYSAYSGDPARDFSSNLSLYLHYGFISPVEIYREVIGADTPSVADFIEQLIVRRHLAFNFVYYNPLYDSFEGLPQWAKRTLSVHQEDVRENLYTFSQLEAGSTHDQYWNAAQKELRVTGTMHNYMRMYWGKKILEWSPTPAEAFDRALKLNNRYQLDGRDPNGFTGVAWCFGKHDRPWSEREVFGQIRYMNDRGLKRKFDMERYLRKVDERCAGSRSLFG